MQYLKRFKNQKSTHDVCLLIPAPSLCFFLILIQTTRSKQVFSIFNQTSALIIRQTASLTSAYELCDATIGSSLQRSSISQNVIARMCHHRNITPQRTRALNTKLPFTTISIGSTSDVGDTVIPHILRFISSDWQILIRKLNRQRN